MFIALAGAPAKYTSTCPKRRTPVLGNKEYVYEVITSQTSKATHAITAPALPFNTIYHQPMCGKYFRTEVTVVRIDLVTCATCKRCLDRARSLGTTVRWKGSVK